MTPIQKQELKHRLIKAHQQACHRENASTQVLKAAYGSNGRDVVRSIQAALGMIGGLHAPVIETHKMIHDLIEVNIKKRYPNLCSRKIGNKIPGFGSSFVKGKPDPMLDSLHWFLKEQSQAYTFIVNAIQEIIKEQKKNILFPNLAFYTAWVGYELNYESAETELLIVEARVPEWVKILKSL